MFRIGREFVSYSNSDITREVYTNIGADTHKDAIESERESLKKAQAEITQMMEAAEKNAEEIISKANENRVSILEKAEAEAALMLEDAKNKGFEEGHDKGYDKGTQQAKREMSEKCSAEINGIRSLLEKIGDERNAVIDRLEDEIIDLVLDISKKVINVQLEKDDKMFVEMIHNALTRLKREGKIVIRVCSEEYRRLFSSGIAEFVVDDETVRAVVTEEPHFETGDCILETDGETINAGVSSQLRQIELAFRSKVNEGV